MCTAGTAPSTRAAAAALVAAARESGRSPALVVHGTDPTCRPSPPGCGSTRRRAWRPAYPSCPRPDRSTVPLDRSRPHKRHRGVQRRGANRQCARPRRDPSATRGWLTSLDEGGHRPQNRDVLESTESPGRRRERARSLQTRTVGRVYGDRVDELEPRRHVGDDARAARRGAVCRWKRPWSIRRRSGASSAAADRLEGKTLGTTRSTATARGAAGETSGGRRSRIRVVARRFGGRSRDARPRLAWSPIPKTRGSADEKLDAEPSKNSTRCTLPTSL